MTAEEIVRKLTKAQRAYLTTKAEWRRPVFYEDRQRMTFPPRRTHAVLVRYGLTDKAGRFTGCGISVRNLLLESSHD